MKNQLIYILLYTFAVYFYMRLVGWWELEVKVLFFRVQRLLLLLLLLLLFVVPVVLVVQFCCQFAASM